MSGAGNLKNFSAAAYLPTAIVKPHDSGFPTPIGAHERILALAERFPWSALYRIAIGYLTVPLYVRLVSGEPGWGLVVWFTCILVVLRLFPAIVRKILPFSDDVRAVWAERRMMAKRFDSYQWQKLLWFGIGLAIHAIASEQFAGTSAVLTAFCLLSGALGLIIWRRRIAVHAAT